MIVLGGINSQNRSLAGPEASLDSQFVSRAPLHNIISSSNILITGFRPNVSYAWHILLYGWTTSLHCRFERTNK